MKGKFGMTISLVTYLGCVIGLTGVALKRNKDAFNAQMENIGLKCDLYATQADNVLKDAKIKQLEVEIDDLKK